MVPVVLMALMFVVQYGLAYHARQVLAGAVNDGAAAAARVPVQPGDGEQVTRALIDEGIGHIIERAAVAASTDGVTVTVTATAKVVAVLPFLDGITVHAAATARPETFDPQGGAP